jgi:roadblock/LC7 domain-containing protein
MMSVMVLLGCLQAGPPVSFEDRILSSIPEGAEAGDILFSPDGRQVAFRARQGGKAFVMVNQARGPAFDAILDAPRFGPDGRTVFYRGRSGAVTSVVVGGKAEAGFEQVGVPVLSHDGKKAAYAAAGARSGGMAGGQAWGVMVGGRKFGGDFLHVGTPAFSAAGDAWAVAVRVPKGVAGAGAARIKEYVLQDGKPGPEFDRIEDLVFSPTGNTVAYRARSGINVGLDEKWTMVVGTKAGATHPVLGPPRFTSDGRLVYVAGSGTKQFVVVDGTRSEEYDTVGTLVFSPDGRSVAYAASKEGKSFVVLEGRPLEPFESVQDPVFSPDGRKVAYAVSRQGKAVMMTGDKPGDALDLMGTPVWSPDSRKTAYWALWKNLYVMVAGSDRSEPYEAVGPPAWSADGSRVAFAAKKENQTRMVIDFMKGEEVYDEVYGAPCFSPDGKKVAFAARKGKDLLWRVLEARGPAR